MIRLPLSIDSFFIYEILLPSIISAPTDEATPTTDQFYFALTATLTHTTSLLQNLLNFVITDKEFMVWKCIDRFHYKKH